ncbi:MAG: phage tail sheath family protein [Prevotella sp.]|nr:phage tail sheath family protein [Prevotella sp.]
MADYKTPGVYVEEISKFPPSVAGVATAIPAFIGFTGKFPEGKQGKPVKISSLLDYENKFEKTDSEGNVVGAELKLDAEGNLSGNKFVLYDSMRLFFDNGGSTCYVISVGEYDDAEDSVGLESYTTPKNVSVFNELKKIDEVTLILFPDAAMMLDFSTLGSLQSQALQHCQEMGDRFAILDAQYNAEPINEDAVVGLDNDMSVFRKNVGSKGLSYGAVYYPYLQTSYTKKISFKEMSNLKEISEFLAKNELYKDYVKKYDYSKVKENVELSLNKEIARFKEIEKFSEDKEGKGELIYASSFVVTKESDFLGSDNAVLVYRELVNLKESDPTKSWTDVISKLSIEYEKKKAALEKENGCLDDISVDEYTGNLSVLDETREGIVELKKRFEDEVAAARKVKIEAEEENKLLEKALIAQIPNYSKLLEKYQKKAAIIPPSGAIAGIYAYVDNNKGVWQAPANISVSSVSAVSEVLSDNDQMNLNVDANTGKSVNAIRDFSDKGIIVWGARTLDGNSNEWRYVPVRRLFNYIEESVQKSTNWAVFQPNDANTWVKVRCQIENFLSNLWRDGALAGSTPDKAFYVRVGLDETMTAQDILEGKMIVEIGLAAVRPAEFIVLKFSHKLQEA